MLNYIMTTLTGMSSIPVVEGVTPLGLVFLPFLIHHSNTK